MSRKSKFLAKVLRHNPEILELNLDAEGWVSIEHLISQMKRSENTQGTSRPSYTWDDIVNIVKADDKGRFSLNESKTMIRAVHGHSICVDFVGSSVEPPKVLYHGTATKYIAPIFKEGIRPIRRRYVHLSQTVDQALQVGSRHGTPELLKVNSGALHKEGQVFYLSSSKVWLTGNISPEYFELVKSY